MENPGNYSVPNIIEQANNLISSMFGLNLLNQLENGEISVIELAGHFFIELDENRISDYTYTINREQGTSIKIVCRSTNIRYTIDLSAHVIIHEMPFDKGRIRYWYKYSDYALAMGKKIMETENLFVDFDDSNETDKNTNYLHYSLEYDNVDSTILYRITNNKLQYKCICIEDSGSKMVKKFTTEKGCLFKTLMHFRSERDDTSVLIQSFDKTIIMSVPSSKNEICKYYDVDCFGERISGDWIRKVKERLQEDLVILDGDFCSWIFDVLDDFALQLDYKNVVNNGDNEIPYTNLWTRFNELGEDLKKRKVK